MRGEYIQVKSCAAGGEDRFRHAMDNLFVSRANGSQHATELGSGAVSVANHEEVRAEPHPAFDWHDLVLLEVEPLSVDQAGFVITLQHERAVRKGADGAFHCGGPVGVGK